MGYSRIVQYATFTETYQYENNLPPRRPRKTSVLIRKRIRASKHMATKSRYAVQRAKTSFFRLVAHNVYHARTVFFFTLTFAFDVSLRQGYRYLARFYALVCKYETQKSSSRPSYIAVPEITKKGRLHFHVLFFNLPPEKVSNERNTRYFQHLWRRGYLTVRAPYDRSIRIAGYMAKYMAKSFKNASVRAVRAYNCSRNIEKVRSYGSHSLHHDFSLFVDETSLTSTQRYSTMYLGACIKKTYHQ